jgi:hypothetical protein
MLVSASPWPIKRGGRCLAAGTQLTLIYANLVPLRRHTTLTPILPSHDIELISIILAETWRIHLLSLLTYSPLYEHLVLINTVHMNTLLDVRLRG